MLFEWLLEIRSRVLLSEYGTVWGTFIAIQVVGVDFGILLGVLIAILDNVVGTAQTTSCRRVQKRSRAVWTPHEYKILQEYGYHSNAPRIVVLEISGPVFFGSSLGLLDDLVDEIGLDEISNGAQPQYASPNIRSPHTPSNLLMNSRQPAFHHPNKPRSTHRPPQFVVIDLSQVSNMDASAARTCFLQFTVMCNKNGIVVCASCATPRMDWILRSHGVAYKHEEEEESKQRVQDRSKSVRRKPEFGCEKMLLFLTTHEALEFCENAIIHQFIVRKEEPELPVVDPQEHTLATVFAKILDSPVEEYVVLQRLNGLRYHDEIEFEAGDKVFAKGSYSESYFVVMSGAVASETGDRRAIYRQKQTIVSGAGLVHSNRGSFSNLLDPAFLDREEPTVVATLWPVCGIFGYSDFLLDRPRGFGATATQNGTKLAKISRSHMNLLAEDAELSSLVHRVLLRISVLDLQNCTCSDV